MIVRCLSSYLLSMRSMLIEVGREAQKISHEFFFCALVKPQCVGLTQLRFCVILAGKPNLGLSRCWKMRGVGRVIIQMVIRAPECELR